MKISTRILSLCLIAPLFIGVSFLLTNVFFNVIDQLYMMFRHYLNTRDLGIIKTFYFEPAFFITINMKYKVLYIILGVYLVFRSILLPFYDLCVALFKQSPQLILDNDVFTETEGERVARLLGEKELEERDLRKQQGTNPQIQVVPVPMLTPEQLAALDKLSKPQVEVQPQLPVEPEIQQVAPQAPKEITPTPVEPPEEQAANPKKEVPKPKVARTQTEVTPPARKPQAFRRNRNLPPVDLEALQEEGFGSVSVPSEIKQWGKEEETK